MVLTYGMGYTLHWPSKAIISTGSLLVKTTTDEVNVYAGDVHKFGTPVRITRLIPKPIEIRVEKDGYFSWEKTLDINAKQTTFVDTTLFKNSEPEVVWEISKDEKVFISSDARYKIIFTAGANQIEIKNPDSSVFLGLDELKLEDFEKIISSEVKWSPDFERAVFSVETNLGVKDFLYTINKPDELEILADEEVALDFINWSYEKPWELKVRDTLGRLYIMNSISKSLESIRDVEINPDLPAGRYQFFVAHEGVEYVRNLSTNTLIKIKDDEIDKMSFGAENYLIASDGRLLMYNDSEIWMKEQGDDFILLLRNSEKIHKVVGIEDAKYVVAQIGGRLVIIEFDGRDVRNQFELARDFEIKDFAINSSGEEILAIGKNSDGTSFVLKVEVQ